MNKINVEHVDFAYATGENVLKDLSFEILPGTVTLLCGASGSGKSTALRLINGLVPHFHHGELHGEVTIGDVDVVESPIETAGLRTATVFQNPATQFFTTEVRSELAFASENYGLPPAEIRKSSNAALNSTGISELANRGLGQLSGGQLQKVACAQAVAQGTPILLFDEPTSNLDPNAIDDFAALLAKYKAAGKTIVIAEHRVYFLRDLVDHVLVLEEGELTKRFSGADFFDQPDSVRRQAGLRTLDRPTLNRSAGKADQSGVYIERLIAGYRGTTVIDLANIEFPAGTITGLIGDNGVGKTTLVRTLCGLHKESKDSRILIDGVVAGAKQRLKRSFLVMQDVHRQLFGETAEAEANGMEYLEAVGLSEVASRHPQSLSGGQKQRLVIATSLSRNTDIYYFDEPTSGVDYRHVLAISQQLRSLAERGAVVVVISHDIEFLNHCVDRIVELTPINNL